MQRTSSVMGIQLSARFAAAACAVSVAAIGLASPALAAPYGPDATTPGEAAVAGALDAIANPATSTYGPMLDSIDDLPDASQRAAALNQLSPRNYRLLPRLAIQSMDATDREIRGYLVQRREMALDAGPDVPSSGDKTITFMLSYGLKQGKYEARTDRPSANSDSRSIRAGVDIAPVEGMILGATLGIDGLDANLDRSQQPRITQFNVNIGPYASYTNGKFYVDATAGYNRSYYKLRRQVSWTGFTDQLQARADGDNAAGTVEAGGILQVGALRAQPFAGLQYRYADVSGFAEHGGTAALGVARYKTESLRGSLGLRTTATVKKGSWAIRPMVEAQWQRELRSHPDSRIEAIFLDGGTPIFTLPAGRYARNAAIVGAGLTAVHGDRTALRLSYNGELAKDRRVHAFAITASRRF
ncbi:outer membrane autotransporter protein [Novosphingobium sp. ST904]|nr:outer membrane autotransporter protein [Novosphingobium sp. ST904]